MDDILVDPLIGVDGHLDGIKVHSHEDSISIELEFNLWIIAVLNPVVCNNLSKLHNLPYEFEGSNNMIAYHFIEDCYKFKNWILVQ